MVVEIQFNPIQFNLMCFQNCDQDTAKEIIIDINYQRFIYTYSAYYQSLSIYTHDVYLNDNVHINYIILNHSVAKEYLW